MRPGRPALALIGAGAFHVDGNFLAKGESSGNAADSWLPAVSPEFISILVYIIHR